MAVLRTRVTGPVMLPDGSPAPDGGKVIFRLLSWDRQDGALIMQGPVEAPVIGGVIDRELERTTSGERGTRYEVAYAYFNAAARQWVSENLGRIALTGSGPVALADLLSIPAPAPNTPDALAQALGAAASAHGDADRAEAAVAEMEDLAQFPLAKGFLTRVEAEAFAGDLSLYGAIQTLGRAGLGDGGAAAYLRTTSAVRGGFQDQAGQNWRPSLDNVIRPETFGAKGGDIGFDDSVGIQNMFDAVMENSINGIGFASLRPGQYYYCGDGADLTVDPAFCGLEGNAGSLIFATRSCSDPALEAEMLSNPSFAGSTGWSGFSTADAAYKNYTVAGTGQAVYEGADAAAGYYAGIWQAVTLTQGNWYRVEVDLDYITYGQREGLAAQQYLSVGVRFGGVDAGDGVTRTYGSGHVGTTQRFDFKYGGPTGSVWFQLKSNNPVKVGRVSLKKLPKNTCLLFDGDYSPFSTQYGPVLGVPTWRQFAMKGKPNPWWTSSDGYPATRFGIGQMWNCDKALLRSEVHMRDVRCGDFGIGVQTANQTYICDWNGGYIGGSRYGVWLGEGNDAGENMRFANITLTAQGEWDDAAAFYNQGRYAHLYGCSIDYFSRAAVRQSRGYTHLTNCHVEKTSPETADKHIIDIESGEVRLDGGYIQLNLRDPIVITAPIRNNGRLIARDTRLWGLQSASGALITGTGFNDVRFSGIGQKEIAPFITRRQRDSLAPGESYNAGRSAWRWLTWVRGGVRVSQYETSYGKVEPLTASPRTAGKNGLKFTKLGGSGNNVWLYVAVPVPAAGMVSAELYARVLAHATNTGSGAIYLDQWRVEMQRDASGDPYYDTAEGDTIGGRSQWAGESRLLRGADAPDWSAGTGWRHWLWNGTQNTYQPNEGAEFGQPWRSHIVFQVLLGDLPTGQELQICDLFATVM